MVIASYEYRPEDVLPVAAGTEGEAPIRERPAVTGVHKFHTICWKGNSRAINVMCGKVGKFSTYRDNILREPQIN